MQSDLRGRVALVTGASRRFGIGAAICRELAAYGADVAFTHWRPYDREVSKLADEEGPSLLEVELATTGVHAAGIECDHSAPDSPQRLFDRVEQLFPGGVSILVNNAAYSDRDGFERLDAATLDAHYEVNLRAMALLSVEFARRFRGSAPTGRIINLSSGQSLGPMPGELAYVATKGAVEAFTRSLAAELAPKGITVNAVNPGPTDSGWMSEELKAEVIRRTGMGRLGRPQDAARLVLFLASDAGQWITGQVIHSEGGFWRS